MQTSILIVDDHEMIRRLLRRYLAVQEDFCILGEAQDGKEAVAKAQELRPDVILMDVAMPGMDGIEATRLIREKVPQVQVVMVTLYASAENCQRAVQAGAAGYILKDFIDEEIVDAIRAVREGKKFFGRDLGIFRGSLASPPGRPG